MREAREASPKRTADSGADVRQAMEALIRDPRLAADLPLDVVMQVGGILRVAEADLISRQMRGEASGPQAVPQAVPDPWLTPREVAQLLRRTPAWVYRQARKWPFAKRPSRKTLLISEHGLRRWLEHR